MTVGQLGVDYLFSCRLEAASRVSQSRNEVPARRNITMTLQLLTFAAGEVYVVVLHHLCILLACMVGLRGCNGNGTVTMAHTWCTLAIRVTSYLPSPEDGLYPQRCPTGRWVYTSHRSPLLLKRPHIRLSCLSRCCSLSENSQ